MHTSHTSIPTDDPLATELQALETARSDALEEGNVGRGDLQGEELDASVTLLRRGARARRRTRRMRRSGSMLALAFVVLSVGLHLWASEEAHRSDEELALATLLLLDEPMLPPEAWDDPLTQLWE